MRQSDETFKIVNDNKTIRSDFTGDGIDDILYIKTEKEKYYIQINAKENSYYLEPNRKLSTVGYFSINWPMKVSLMDISRDKIPEIFIQSSQKSRSIQHIFKWSGSDFIDIFCSTNNVMGFIDTQSNRTPKFISGNLSSANDSFLYYMMIGSDMKNIEYDLDVPGKKEISSFINYIESLPLGEINKPKNIFSPSMGGKELAAIGKLCSENNTYSFQDAIFIDTSANKNGDISEVRWTLNFRGCSNTSQDIKAYILTVKLSAILDGDKTGFKISNLNYK